MKKLILTPLANCRVDGVPCMRPCGFIAEPSAKSLLNTCPAMARRLALVGGLVFAIEESVDLAHEIYNSVFRKVPERLVEK
jgi:hypothetical protein